MKVRFAVTQGKRCAFPDCAVLEVEHPYGSGTVPEGTHHAFMPPDPEWRWVLDGDNGEPLCWTEGYKDVRDAIHAFALATACDPFDRSDEVVLRHFVGNASLRSQRIAIEWPGAPS